MSEIFESVPNISEGCELKKLDQLVAVVRKTPDIEVLDFSADPDHNRSVLTFIGTRQGIIEANFNLVQKATELLNIQEHQGVHPRVGIIDVIPIIPVLNVTMIQAVKLTYTLGEMLESKLKIPVYYYEHSAKNEKYRNLANIRREKYNIGVHPEAGAVCIGARDYLVAYNVNLETTDQRIARAIAHLIREANGGEKNLKALGLFLKSKNCAQVSMNLTNPRVTDTKKAYAAVKKAAAQFKVGIKNDELIGLLPKQVKAAAEKFALKQSE